MLSSEAKDVVKNISSSMSSAKEAFSTLSSVTNIYKSVLDDLIVPLSTWEPIANDISKYFHGHYHNDHMHQYCHFFNINQEARPGANINIYTNMPPVNFCNRRKNKPVIDPIDNVQPILHYLTREFTMDSDFDGNGLIFGRDFVFNPKDRRVPFELRRLQLMKKKLILTLPKMEWLEYLNTTWSQCPWHRRICKGRK